MATANP
jgi:hypothetical protein